LTSRPLDYRISYHADQDLDALRSFWGHELGIEPTSIAGQPKTNSGQLSGRVWRCAHGVLTIRTSDTYFRARLHAWIDCLKQEWDREQG
jgi:hypothetical protein